MNPKTCTMVTERIIEHLKEGVIPWQRPWSSSSLPYNPITQRFYSGLNTFLLGAEPFEPQLWSTFAQIGQAGGKVRKGQRSGGGLTHGYSKAFYHSGDDQVCLPSVASFESESTYYGVLFHELAYSTGYQSRLDRLSSKLKGDGEYAREELIAELAASMLCAHTGVDNNLQRPAHYLQSWMKCLEGDHRLIVKASSAARNVLSWVLGQTTSLSHTCKTQEVAC